MKIRSRSSSTIPSLEQDKSPSTDKKVPGVSKRPLGEQLSNPELSRRVKPPRPPPPNRQIPPRTYTHLDGKTNLVRSSPKDNRTPVAVVVDTRAQRRQRHARLPQPERPPLPYETFILKKQSHTTCIASGQDATAGDNLGRAAAVKEQHGGQMRTMMTTPPADYEVVVPVAASSLIKCSISGNIPTSTNTQPLPSSSEAVAAAGGAKTNDHKFHNKEKLIRRERKIGDDHNNESDKKEEAIIIEAQVKDLATVPSFTKQQPGVEINNYTDQGSIL